MADHFHAIPDPRTHETILSQTARAIFSRGPIYYIIQAATAAILILAANTSFAGFPRLASIMASDRFLPRQLSNLGDRLVFTNGILALGLVASLLVIIFKGDTHLLIPLYAVGVFLAFTLSQTGMVRHWFKLQGKSWARNALINGVGATVTAVVLAVIVITKFTHGAWMVVFAIPAIVYVSIRIERHYRSVSEQLMIPVYFHESEFKHHSVIVPVSGVQTAVINAVKYAKALSSDVVAIYVCLNPAEAERFKADWEHFGMGVPLLVLDSPYRSITRPLMDYIDKVRDKYKDGVITVLLPEFVPSKWWQHLLHNQTAFIIRGLLHFKPGVVIISVPLHLKK